jgi:hypothetical protein
MVTMERRHPGGQNLWTSILVKVVTATRRDVVFIACLILVFLGSRSFQTDTHIVEDTGNNNSNNDPTWWWESSSGWGRPKAPDMTIIILSMDRFESLQRLVTSLQSAVYNNHQDILDLTIRFDRPPASKYPYQKWIENVQNFRDSLDWKHGTVRISIAPQTLGLAEAWFQAWHPNSDEERAVIFEDDLEVSPVWYQWLKGAHDAYGRDRDDLAAFSLSHQELVPLKTSKKTTKGFPQDEPFMYALLGSHGFSPLARVWREFLGFVKCSRQREGNMTIETPELVTSDWYHYVVSKSSMWTQHFIYFTKHHKMYSIYQFPHDKALAAHWQEKGEHFDGKTRGRNYPLIQKGDISMKFPKDLKKFDWGANEVLVNTTVLPPVVMSAAIGYPLDRFEAFVGSLRRYYAGDIWLLISSKTAADVREYLHQQKVKTVETEERLAAPASKEWERMNRSRFTFFVSVCNATRYSLCLTTDFRDSIFQANPFQFIGENNMEVSASSVLDLHEHRTVMNSWHFDGMVICGLYNEYRYFLEGKMIINGGSMIGSPLAFQQLNYYMNDKWKTCNDQVTLNILARANLLQNITLRVHPQGQGVMNVLGYGGEVIRDSNGRFLNSNCLVSPVVHQYDHV